MSNKPYVNAGITQPLRCWLDALRGGGRRLVPLQGERGLGGMLLVERPASGGSAWQARFVSRASFISCQAAQIPETGPGLTAAFAAGLWHRVKSLRLDDRADESCWFQGQGWWLSTRSAQGDP